MVDQPRMVYSNEKNKIRLMQELVYLQVGKVMDAVEKFIELHVRDKKGEKLHDNRLRTERCARYLRRYTRARCAKTEAFSIMLQEVGHKYRHTFVLSTLIVKNDKVYRLTIILY